MKLAKFDNRIEPKGKFVRGGGGRCREGGGEEGEEEQEGQHGGGDCTLMEALSCF